MKHFATLSLFTLLLCSLQAQTHRDSIDIIHYDIHLDIHHAEPWKHIGFTDITLHSLYDTDQIVLDLIALQVDSVLCNNIKIEGYELKRGKLRIPQNLSVNDTAKLTIHYKGNQTLEPYRWGGIHYDENIIYNLGVAFQAYPHNYGRAWFPCIDSFTDKATYDFHFTFPNNKTLTCSGVLQHFQSHSDGSAEGYWTLNTPTPSYLISFALADYKHLQDTLQGLHRSIPYSIYAYGEDTARVKITARGVQKGLLKLEECFGEYPFARVGYCITPKGSMEHVNNIALARPVALDTSNNGRSVFLHEMSHAWFGNFLTCKTSGDMFFNEGGASFCEEIAFEGLYGKEFAKQYARSRNKKLFLKLIHDEGNFPLANVNPQRTYSTTIYKKGAAVFHGLRGYMGDSLFYDCMKQIFANRAFGNISIDELETELSRFSQLDLNPFFDFYLRDSGFIHYYNDSIVFSDQTATLHLKQNTLHSHNTLRESRLPVTFFDSELNSLKRMVSFSGNAASISIHLPFQPAFACLDLDEEIFDATTDTYVIVSSDTAINMPEAYTKISINTNQPVLIRSVLHWVGPYNPHRLPEGVERVSPNHYWTIEGNASSAESISGSFYYERSLYQPYPFDPQLYTRSSQFDSLILLYRPNAGTPWQPVSCIKTGRTEGYITTNNLRPGEYVMGIGNPRLNLNGLHQGNIKPLKIYPNPTHQKIMIELPYTDEDFECYITNINGQKLPIEQNKPNTHSNLSISFNQQNGIHSVTIYYPNRKETFSASVVVIE